MIGVAAAYPSKFAETVADAVGAHNFPESYRTPPVIDGKKEADVAADTDRIVAMIKAIAIA